MNDFDYDCLEKKRLARSAFARKGTRNRKGCRLPHENLTKKEREALNGEVYSVSMNAPISWERFKALTPSLQSDYLNHLVEKFGVGINTISKDLFGLSAAGLANHINRRGLKVSPHKGKISQAAYVAWYKWIEGEPSIAPVSEDEDKPHVCTIDYEPDETKSTSDQPVFRAHDYEDMLKECDLAKKDRKISETPPYSCPLQDMGINLEGTPVEIMTTLANAIPALLDKDKTYRFSIKVDRFFLTHGDRVL